MHCCSGKPTRRFQSLLLSSVLLVSRPLWAQTTPAPSHPNREVAGLLDKVAEALGGWEKVRSVRAMRRKLTTREAEKTYQSEELLLPDSLRLETNALGYPATLIVSPPIGVLFATGRPDNQLTPGQKETFLTYCRFNLIFLLQQTSNPAYEFSVREGEKIGDVETRMLEVKGYSARDLLYVDLQSGRVLRDVEFLPDGKRTAWDNSDWATVDGMTLPLTAKARRQEHAGFETTVEVQNTAMEFNPSVDDRLFQRNGASLGETPMHPAPMLPAPEPPRTATLRVSTRPGNAQAYLNDEFRGTSSAEGNLTISALRPGTYRLRFSSLGYTESARTVELKAGETATIEAKLEPAGPKPLALAEIEEALTNGLPPKGITKLVNQYGVDFVLTKETEQRLRGKGADSDLLLAIATGKK